MEKILSNGIELKGKNAERFFNNMAKEDRNRIAQTLIKAIEDKQKAKVVYYKMRGGRVVDQIIRFE